MITTVVKILSDTELVLGAGSDKGLGEGMEFVIFEEGEEILDPVTKQSLGTLQIIKGYVTVINVQQKLSIAKTKKHTVTRTRQVTVNPLAQLLSSYTREESYEVDQIEKLKVDKTDPEYAKKLIVRVGDKARMTHN